MDVYYSIARDGDMNLIPENVSLSELQFLREGFEEQVWVGGLSTHVENWIFEFGINDDEELYGLFIAA